MAISGDASAVITNVLYRVGDPNASTYSSGQVAYLVFAHLGDLNGNMGTCFSGTINDGYFFPEITGTLYQPVLELMVAKNLVGNSLFSSANTFSLTSFREGDSVVNIADRTKAFAALYAVLSKELTDTINQVKFTIVSQSPSTVLGTDAGAVEQIGYRNYNVYLPNQA